MREFRLPLRTLRWSREGVSGRWTNGCSSAVCCAEVRALTSSYRAWAACGGSLGVAQACEVGVLCVETLSWGNCHLLAFSLRDRCTWSCLALPGCMVPRPRRSQHRLRRGPRPHRHVLRRGRPLLPTSSSSFFLVYVLPSAAALVFFSYHQYTASLVDSVFLADVFITTVTITQWLTATGSRASALDNLEGAPPRHTLPLRPFGRRPRLWPFRVLRKC